MYSFSNFLQKKHLMELEKKIARETIHERSILQWRSVNSAEFQGIFLRRCVNITWLFSWTCGKWCSRSWWLHFILVKIMCVWILFEIEYSFSITTLTVQFFNLVCRQKWLSEIKRLEEMSWRNLEERLVKIIWVNKTY